MSSVAFSQAKDAELAWIDGEIHFSSNTSKSILGQEAGDNEETTDGVPVLDVLPQTLVNYGVNLHGILMLFLQTKGHSNVFVNPPRLTDFKQVLTKAGFQVRSLMC